MVDFYNLEDQCINGSDHSRLKRYCAYSAHDYKACKLKRMCRWLPNELSQNLSQPNLERS